MEEIVRQVGYILELYKDARSEKYLILQNIYCNTNHFIVIIRINGVIYVIIPR
jgi:hypothetical protein